MSEVGTGFMKTDSVEDSRTKIAELQGYGFITQAKIVDDGFVFRYTGRGRAFARSLKEEAVEVGLPLKDYVDIFMSLQCKGDVNGNDTKEMGNT